MPGESAVRVHQTKEPEHKQDFDEWLARIICYAFSVPPQWAVKLMNRAKPPPFPPPLAGRVRVGAAQAEDEGLEPTKEWVKDLVDEVIAEEFASPDLELMWLDEDSGAAQIEAQFEARVKIGAATLNELREALGLDPFANPAADRPMVLTPTGYVPIEAGAGGNASPPPSAQAANERSTADASPAYQKAAVDDPEHPGWPAGTPGGIGGQFRPKDGDASNSGNSNVILVADKVTPNGFTLDHVPGDPLDPQKVNKPVSPDEQQRIADTLTLFFNQQFGTLEPHTYKNYPHPVTGAVLPPSTSGYIAIDVPGVAGAGPRGQGRIIIDTATGAFYYTNTHYWGFYRLNINPRGE